MRHLDVDDALLRRLAEIDVARTHALAAWTSRDATESFSARRFGGATALRDPSRRGEGMYNRVVGFSAKDLDQLDELIAYYAEIAARGSGISWRCDRSTRSSTTRACWGWR